MAYIRTREATYPPTEVVLVTPSDTTLFDPPLRAVSIGTAGTLVVDTPSSSNVAIPANCLAVGIQHIGVFLKIRAASTATQIVGWR